MNARHSCHVTRALPGSSLTPHCFCMCSAMKSLTTTREREREREREILHMNITHLSAFLRDRSPRRFFITRAIMTVIAIMRTITTATTPPIMAVVLCELTEAVVSVLGAVPLLVVLSVVVMLLLVVESVVGGEHFSLRDEIATEHSESTFISTPFTTALAPPLTQSSIREMREPLSASEVPLSLARYVTYVGDSG